MIDIWRRSLPEDQTIDPSKIGSPSLFVTDTLGDPNHAFERGTGIYGELSKSQEAANEVKRTQPITVVIGNPPYKEKAKGKGSWIEQGSGNVAAPLNDWQPPKKWGVGAHAKHLRNLYIYFWRWAAWKVFEQGTGGRDKTPPVEEHLSGMVCFITVAGFLNGPGFQKMRADLRRDCDEIWVIDCSPEGHQPEVATRIFEGVQHPVCITIASRSPDNDPAKPARVHYRQLAKGKRDQKFEELKTISLPAKGWIDGATDWRAPFLPELTGGWADFVPLDSILGDVGPGVMPGRTWVVAPDVQSLKDRWAKLQSESDKARKELLFHPQLRGGKLASRHMNKVVSDSLGVHPARTLSIAKDSGQVAPSVRYGFRSFDRQWIPADPRLMNDPRKGLWDRYSDQQIFLTGLMAHSPTSGPAVTTTALIPDQHQYKGSFGGRVFALWEDAGAKNGNIVPAAMAALTKTYGAAPSPEDVFAYVAALLANPAYTETFKSDLVRPGLRVPLTADKKLFDKAAEIGREVIWLHTFGERFADPGRGRPAGQPKLPDAERPKVVVSIPDTPEGFPDAIDYDPTRRELKIGSGVIAPVAPEVWVYEVSGKPVLRQWFSYRKKNREKPQIGDRRPPSPLGEIQPDHWLPEYTTELLNVINVLGLLVKLEPKQKPLLDEIVDGPLIPASKVALPE